MADAAFAASMLALGLGIAIVVASLRTPVPPRRLHRPRRTRWWARNRGRLLLGLAGGVVTSWVSSIPVTLVAVPVLVVVISWLLETPPNRELDLLEAMDRWIRALGTSISAGRSVTDAIRSSRRTAPALLRDPLSLVLRRLDERWTLREALNSMAKDMGSPSVDAVLAALILAADRGGTGVSTTLIALADSTQDQLRAWREIEAERAKPRIVVRQVTMLSAIVLGLGFVAGGGYFAPYRTARGQAILVLLLVAYAASLVVLRRMTTPRARARILTGSGHGQ